MVQIVLTGIITAILVLIVKERQPGISVVLLLAGSLAIFFILYWISAGYCGSIGKRKQYDED